MTINVQFKFDKTSVFWEENSYWHMSYCRNAVSMIMALYQLNGFITLSEVCSQFGVMCPLELCGLVFRYTEKQFKIDLESFDDHIVVTCTYEP